MINLLFRTGFESNTSPFIVFLALHAFLATLLFQSGVDSHDGPWELPYATIIAWQTMFGLATAALALLRHYRERRTRLYAQLPVTALQVRLAYWALVALHLCISLLVLVLAMLLLDDLPVLDVLQFAVLFLTHGITVMAVLSLAFSNSVRLIPDEIRRRTIAYFFLATLITFLFLLAIGFTVQGYAYVLNGGEVDWGSLTAVMTLLAAALIALDVRLFSRRDAYLG